jgi:hypothetical protein
MLRFFENEIVEWPTTEEWNSFILAIQRHTGDITAVLGLENLPKTAKPENGELEIQFLLELCLPTILRAQNGIQAAFVEFGLSID